MRLYIARRTSLVDAGDPLPADERHFETVVVLFDLRLERCRRRARGPLRHAEAVDPLSAAARLRLQIRHDLRAQRIEPRFAHLDESLRIEIAQYLVDPIHCCRSNRSSSPRIRLRRPADRIGRRTG